MASPVAAEECKGDAPQLKEQLPAWLRAANAHRWGLKVHRGVSELTIIDGLRCCKQSKEADCVCTALAITQDAWVFQ